MFTIVSDDELINSLVLTQKSIDRLEFISMSDPLLAIKTSEFLETFPEFQNYRSIAPSTKRVIKFDEDWQPKTLFEYIIYYICISGVKYSYAIQQYKKIVTFLRSDTWVTINEKLYTFLNTTDIQEKKKEIYWFVFLDGIKRNLQFNINC